MSPLSWACQAIWHARKDFWRGYSQPGIQLVGLRSSWLPSLQHHENIRRGGLDGTSEMLRGVRRVDRIGKRENRNARYVFEPQVFVRPVNVGGVLCRGGCGGGVDRRSSGVSTDRRHRHSAVIGHGQAIKTRIGRNNISQRRNRLPLTSNALDLGDGDSSAAVRRGAGRTGSRSVSPWAVFPVAPVNRALLLSVPLTASPYAARGTTAFGVLWAAMGPAVMAGRVPSNSSAPVVPVAGAVARAVPSYRAITNSRVPVDPIV